MMNGDELNAALEEAEQSVLRQAAKKSVKAGGPAHYFSESDTFDRIPGVGLARRNNHTAALHVPSEGEYGG